MANNNIINEDSKIVFASTYSRMNGQPLDDTIIWDSYSKAQAYARDDKAYVGQMIAVVTENEAKAYIIKNTAGDLDEIGSGTGSGINSGALIDPTGNNRYSVRYDGADLVLLSNGDIRFSTLDNYTDYLQNNAQIIYNATQETNTTPYYSTWTANNQTYLFKKPNNVYQVSIPHHTGQKNVGIYLWLDKQNNVYAVTGNDTREICHNLQAEEGRDLPSAGVVGNHYTTFKLLNLEHDGQTFTCIEATPEYETGASQLGEIPDKLMYNMGLFTYYFIFPEDEEKFLNMPNIKAQMEAHAADPEAQHNIEYYYIARSLDESDKIWSPTFANNFQARKMVYYVDGHYYLVSCSNATDSRLYEPKELTLGVFTYGSRSYRIERDNNTYKVIRITPDNVIKSIDLFDAVNGSSNFVTGDSPSCYLAVNMNNNIFGDPTQPYVTETDLGLFSYYQNGVVYFKEGTYHLPRANPIGNYQVRKTEGAGQMHLDNGKGICVPEFWSRGTRIALQTEKPYGEKEGATDMYIQYITITRWKEDIADTWSSGRIRHFYRTIIKHTDSEGKLANWSPFHEIITTENLQENLPDNLITTENLQENLPSATESALGCIKTGYQSHERKYALKTSANKGYIEIDNMGLDIETGAEMFCYDIVPNVSTGYEINYLELDNKTNISLTNGMYKLVLCLVPDSTEWFSTAIIETDPFYMQPYAVQTQDGFYTIKNVMGRIFYPSGSSGNGVFSHESNVILSIQMPAKGANNKIRITDCYYVSFRLASNASPAMTYVKMSMSQVGSNKSKNQAYFVPMPEYDRLIKQFYIK